MKKIIFVLLIGIFSIIILPNNVYAKSISTLEATGSNNKISIFGTTESGVLAVSIWVYKGTELVSMESCSNNVTNYSCELSKEFSKGDYTVKVADYEGGDFIFKDVTVTDPEVNPQTGDNIMLSFIISAVSILGI